MKNRECSWLLDFYSEAKPELIHKSGHVIAEGVGSDINTAKPLLVRGVTCDVKSVIVTIGM